jgi:hypothetical protein
LDVNEPGPIDLDDLKAAARPRYSICTLVTRPGEYDEMVASFRALGFNEPECELIFADNSRGNRYDGSPATTRSSRWRAAVSSSFVTRTWC